jgi:hypothetical protein
VNIKQYDKVLMYFNNNILLNPILLNARRPTARLLKIHMNITIYGSYLHTKLWLVFTHENIDIVEHLHIQLWYESSISGVFLLIFLNILRKLGHIINQRYNISKERAQNVPAKPSGSPYMATRLTEGRH